MVTFYHRPKCLELSTWPSCKCGTVTTPINVDTAREDLGFPAPDDATLDAWATWEANLPEMQDIAG